MCCHVCTPVPPGESSEIFAIEILGLFVIPCVHACVCVCVCACVVMRTTNFTHFEIRGFSQDLTEQSRLLGYDAVYPDVSVN